VNDQQLLRYARHLMLDAVGIEGQSQLLNSHVLIVGAGGLGCAAGLYLASAGVGHITLIDDDVVDLTNLQRQIGHTTARLGQAKVQSLATAMHEVNPEVRVTGVAARTTAAWLAQHTPQANVVLDCSDNFATRHEVNRACAQAKRPLVSGAAIKTDGQLAVFRLDRPDAPCYACVFDPDAAPSEAQCATLGVLAPLVGMVGSMQAAEAMRLLVGHDGGADNQLRLLHAGSLRLEAITLAQRADCPVCQAAGA
jgi:molybdopterin/thiamine biosynthesis adenylyltransferase